MGAAVLLCGVSGGSLNVMFDPCPAAVKNSSGLRVTSLPHDSASCLRPAGRLYAMQTGMKLDSKAPECRKFLIKLMDQLELVSPTPFKKKKTKHRYFSVMRTSCYVRDVLPVKYEQLLF